MSFRPFTSESYSEGDRLEAWRDVLRAVGLQPSAGSAVNTGHATASRRNAEGVVLARLAAGSQAVSPLPHPAGDMPIMLLPTEDGVTLRTATGHQIISIGHLLLLPRKGDWSVSFQRDMRAIVLSVTPDAFGGRKIAGPVFDQVRVLAPTGFTEVFSRTLESAARNLETLSDSEWAAVAQSLADLLPTFVRQLMPATDAGATATRAAILHRLCQTIERRLDDADLTPARVADAEGISERYLQKLFEGSGSSFTHYVRERRLQRASAELSSPAEAHHSISEIAYRNGFNDSAHFSRAFRHRFGLSPREFRQQELERASASAVTGQRGWPQQALAQLRSHYPLAGAERSAGPAPADKATCCTEGEQHRHHLAVEAARVHWGYFSRSMPPQIEINSGETITIETLTQHASDDPERMIKGDAGAESVFHWTREAKNVDRRGAGPMDASVYGRGAGEGFGVHICTGPVAVKDAQPGDVLEVRILDIVPRPSRNPDFEGQVFGSSVAAWWGYHYSELLAEPNPREAVTIYEIFDHDEAPHARALYSYRWEPQTDPFGVVHTTYDYPGVPVRAGSVKRRHNVLDGIRIPLRPHFGVIAVAPREVDFVEFDSAVLFRRQSRQLAARQGIDRLSAGLGAGRAALGRRSPCDPGRRRTRRHRDRMLDDRHVPAHPAQEGGSGGPRVRRPHLSPDRDRDRMGVDRLQPPELSRRVRRQGPERGLCHLLARSRDEGRLPQDAALPDAHQGPERGRGDRADVGRGRFRRHASGGRQLGRPRHPEQAPVRRRPARLICFPSWPGSSRPSASFCRETVKTWMPGTRPGMTSPARPELIAAFLNQTLRSIP